MQFRVTANSRLSAIRNYSLSMKRVETNDKKCDSTYQVLRVRVRDRVRVLCRVWDRVRVLCRVRVRVSVSCRMDGSVLMDKGMSMLIEGKISVNK